jgi:hypothetical protein
MCEFPDFLDSKCHQLPAPLPDYIDGWQFGGSKAQYIILNLAFFSFLNGHFLNLDAALVESRR